MAQADLALIGVVSMVRGPIQLVQAAVALRGVDVVDMSDCLCSEETCPFVVGRCRCVSRHQPPDCLVRVHLVPMLRQVMALQLA